MLSQVQPSRLLRAFFLIGIFAPSVGCNRDSAVEFPVDVFPARGKVTFNGQPMPGAVIYLHPLDANSQPRPHATVDTSGGFQLSTFRQHDGAPAGVYRATVSWKLVPADQAEFLNREDRDEGEEQLPLRYQQPHSTPLEIEIRPGTNDLGTWEIQP